MDLDPGQHCLKNDIELHGYARVQQTLRTLNTAIYRGQHDVGAGQDGIKLDWPLALLDGL